MKMKNHVAKSRQLYLFKMTAFMRQYYLLTLQCCRKRVTYQTEFDILLLLVLHSDNHSAITQLLLEKLSQTSRPVLVLIVIYVPKTYSVSFLKRDVVGCNVFIVRGNREKYITDINFPLQYRYPFVD